jgi:hypothetical protein
MRIFYFPVIAACLLLSYCSREKEAVEARAARPTHSLAGELKAFHDIGLLPFYLDSSSCAQVSTYDTTWGNDDGFSGRYSFLRRNDDSSLVLFDIKGGGVINRIWTPTPGNDTLDFFIDDTLKPTFSVCYTDLFSGNKYPFTEPLCGNQLGGFFCYLPIPFEKSCRIIYRGKKEQFHQIQYRLYNKGAKIKSFRLNLDDDEKEALNKIKSLWSKEKMSPEDFYTGKLSIASGQFDLKPGSATTIFETRKGGRILGIELSPPEVFEGLNKNTDIRITWDKESTPAVFAPVADFFGFAFGSASMQSLLLGTRDKKSYCYFPMPFDRSAKIELIQRKSDNSSAGKVSVKAKIWYSDVQRVPAEEGKFYAQWEKKPLTGTGRPHIIAEVTGKGHYVGTLLQAQGLRAGMTIFFEGDDSTSIDGNFRLHGTGSEDYFNGGWYAMMDRWDDKMSLPLHGSLGYSLPFCRTGGYRLYLSDKLSFGKSFYQSIEHGPVRNEVPADYTSLGLYYCDTPLQKVTQPSAGLTGVFIPDSLYVYPQLLDLTLYGRMNVETTWKYGTGGESYLFTPGTESWLRMSLREIPEGNYRMYVDVMKGPSGCDFSLWQRQKQVSDWLSSFSIAEERAKDLYICDLNIPETSKTVTIRFRTDKKKSSLLLNRILLIRK